MDSIVRLRAAFGLSPTARAHLAIPVKPKNDELDKLADRLLTPGF